MSTPRNLASSRAQGRAGRLEVVRSAEETGGALLELRVYYKPHSARPPGHYHPVQAEHFTVLAGRLATRVARKSRVLVEGEELDVAPRSVHQMWNDGDIEAVVSWEIRPTLRTQDFLTAIWSSRSLLEQLLLVRRYRAEYRLARPPVAVQDLVFWLLTPLARLYA